MCERRLSRLCDRLKSEGGLYNAFGPTPDGDLMLEAAAELTSCRWLIAELADHLNLVRDLAAKAGILEDDHDDILAEACRIAEEKVA